MVNKGNKMWLITLTAVMCVFLAVSFLAGCKTTTVAETTAAETAAASTTASETTASADTTTAAETTASGINFSGEQLVISGSNTMLEVGNAWAEAFMAKFGGEITINGQGSGVGIADMINKTNDIANASRKIKDEEAEEAKAAGIDVKEFIVLFDGISIIVSKNINITEISIQQLSDIYIEKITNWKEIGGPDAPIIAYARDSSSGTGEYFLEEIIQLGKTMKDNDYGTTVLRLQSTADIVNQVIENENGIGYIGLGYLSSAAGKSNVLKVKKDDNSAGIEPNAVTVKDKSYPIARELYIYTDANRSTEFANAFIDFVLSEEGQQIGADSGFVGIK